MSPEEEREQKDEEAELPPEHTMPLHDPDHGNSPGRGLPNTDKGGRPKRGTA
jgi:hypothetical protein